MVLAGFHHVVDVARWKFSAFYEKHFYAQQHYSQSYKEYGQKQQFHGVEAQMRCKYMKVGRIFCGLSI